jgi:hypothetical protein
MIEKRVVLRAVYCLLLTGLCGCTAPLALQGLSSATPVTFNATGRGAGDSAWLARYDDVVQATLRAGEVLSLNLEKKEIGEGQAVFQYIDGKGKKMNILIERRTETMTYARFSVGLFGSKSMGQLMVRQIIFEINEEGKFLQDWHPVEAD